MQAIPQPTLAVALWQQLGAWVNGSTSHRSRDDIAHRRLFNASQRLLDADADHAFALQAILAAMTGDESQARALLDRIRSPEVRHGTAATVLVNLGFFSESIPHYRFSIDVRVSGGALANLRQGVSNGAYASFAAASDVARTMYPATVDSAFPAQAGARAIVQVLRDNGDTEADVAAALDIAGDMLREKRLFDYGHDDANPRIVSAPPDGMPPYFTLALRVAVSEADALDMTLELVDRLASSPRRIPASMNLHFASVYAKQ